MKLALATVCALAAGFAPPPSPYLVTVSSRDGRIAWADGATWQVWVARADGSGARKLGGPWNQGVGQLTWTPYGLLVDSNYTLYLLPPSGKPVKIGITGDQTFTVAGVHAASGSAGCGYCKGPVTVYNLRTHTAVRVGDPAQANEDPALSPDGSRLVWSTARGLVERAVRGGPVRTLAAGGGCGRWSPNGKTIAFFHLNTLETVPAAGGTPTVLLRKAVCQSRGEPEWSPDSRTVAIPYGPRRLALVDVSTHAVRKTPVALGRVADFTWSPDGTSLVATFGHDGCANVLRLSVSGLAPMTVYAGCP